MRERVNVYEYTYACVDACVRACLRACMRICEYMLTLREAKTHSFEEGGLDVHIRVIREGTSDRGYVLRVCEAFESACGCDASGVVLSG